MHPKEYSIRSFIMDIIEDCNLEQLETVMGWTSDLFRRGHLKTDTTAYILGEAIIRKRRSILNHKSDSSDNKTVLPHIKKRIAKIEYEQRKRKLKLVKSISS